jgi:hypothetical protein
MSERKDEERSVGVAEIKDAPGYWILTERLPEQAEGWRVLRKPDGTFWEVTGTHYFPPGGGSLELDLGQQISDRQLIRELESFYTEARNKIDAGNSSSE